MSKYHSLLSREKNSNARWAIEFGDYSKAVVTQEKKDTAKPEMEYKIITTDEDQDAINFAVDELNVNCEHTKRSAVQYLMRYTHQFYSQEYADKLTKPFGIKARCYLMKANPRDPNGLTLANGAKEAVGVASWTLAAQICDHLKLRAESKMGRGSQQRAYCEAIIRYLDGEGTKKCA